MYVKLKKFSSSPISEKHTTCVTKYEICIFIIIALYYDRYVHVQLLKNKAINQHFVEKLQ